MEVKGKKVLVFGLGISGIGAGKILERQGAEVVLYDGNKKLMEEKVRQQSGADSNAKIIIGEFPEEILAELDMTVLSPGVPTDLPVIEKMRKQGITVIGEVELISLEKAMFLLLQERTARRLQLHFLVRL